MQIHFQSAIAASSLGVPAFGDGIASLFINGQVQLIYDIMPTGGSGLLSLGSWSGTGMEFEVDGDFALVDTGQDLQLFSFTGPGSYLHAATLMANGTLGASRIVTVGGQPVENVMDLSSYLVAAGSFVALARWNTPGLSLFEVDPSGNLAQTGSIADTDKTYLSRVSDTITVEVDGNDFLLAASDGDNGLTLFRILPDGSLEMSDALGKNDGLPVNGLAAITLVEAWGNTYAVVGATLTSSLSVVRINEMGVMFLEDMVYDTTETRFARVAALDTFQANGRTFVVAAGNDAGITILEMMPDGTLDVVTTYQPGSEVALGTVTGLEAVVIDGVVHIEILQATRTTIAEFTVPLSTLGGIMYATADVQLTGTSLDDLIFGSDGNDNIRGGSGDDRIVDGDGADSLRGNGGADVFILVADGEQDTIYDFQNGSDRIDVSDWGYLYTASELEIIPIPGGAEVRYGDESVIIYASNGRTLTDADLTDADFIF